MLLSIPSILVSFALTVAASPIQSRDDIIVDINQIDATNVTDQAVAESKIQAVQGDDPLDPADYTVNEFTEFGCRDVIFFFAKGSTEPGNLGDSLGIPTADGLQERYGSENVAVQGIDYPGLIITNLLPGGADYAGIAKAIDLFKQAATQCPKSTIVAAGYSQGAALMHRAVQYSADNVKARIAGVVTYGDTQKKQDKAQIPSFPKDKVLIICNPGDLVCEGTLILLGPHFEYPPRVPEGVEFLISKIDAF